MKQKLHYLIAYCLLFCILCPPVSVSGQRTSPVDKWDNLLQRYKSNTLSDSAYLSAIDTLASQDFSAHDMKERLSVYKDLVWAKSSQKKRRTTYYQFLMANAFVSGETGKQLFYLEKMEKENTGTNSLIYGIQKIQLYLAWGNKNEQAMALYRELLPQLELLPEKISADSVKPFNIRAIVSALQKVSQALMDKKDIVGFRHLRQLTHTIYDSVHWTRNTLPYKGFENLTKTYLISIDYQMFLLDGDTSAAEKKAQEMLSLSGQLGTPGKPVSIAQKLQKFLAVYELTHFYTMTGNKDSAGKYMALENSQMKEIESAVPKEFYIKFYKQNSDVQELTGDSHGARENLLKAYNLTDSILQVKNAVIADNMFAEANAEDSQEMALTETRKKQQLRIFALLAVVLMSGVIAVIYRRGRKLKAQSEKTVAHLRTVSGLQINELEERLRIEKMIQQKQMGMDLHDGVAGQLAVIKKMLDSYIFDTEDPRQLQRLYRVNGVVLNAYNSARQKSHEWMDISGETDSTPFPDRIRHMLQTAFPKNRYNLDIQLQEEVLTKLELPEKIEILYIIQEAMANIVKYADATTITLKVFEKEGQKKLFIKDNGKGFKLDGQNAEHGAGLSNIKERARKLNGSAQVYSGPGGTGLSVSF